MSIKSFLRAYKKAQANGDPTLISLIEGMAGEGLVDTTDLLISDAAVAKDLVVFDTQSRDTLWWLRVWALRESKLPVRILKWHRNNGRHIELVFTYSREQPPEFFDAQAFAEQLKDPNVDAHHLMHSFFETSGEDRRAKPGN